MYVSVHTQLNPPPHTHIHNLTCSLHEIAQASLISTLLSPWFPLLMVLCVYLPQEQVPSGKLGFGIRLVAFVTSYQCFPGQVTASLASILSSVNWV